MTSISPLNPAVTTIQRNLSHPLHSDICCLQHGNLTDCTGENILTVGAVSPSGSFLACVAIAPGQAVLHQSMGAAGSPLVDPMPDVGAWSPNSRSADVVKRQQQGNVVFPIIALGVLAGVFVSSWLVSLLLDKRRITDTQALREALYLRIGGPSSSASAEPPKSAAAGAKARQASPVPASAIKPAAAAKADVEYHLKQLRKARTSSLPNMALTHLAQTSKAYLLERHTWFAVFAHIPPGSESPRRAQRIAQLCVMCITSMAVCAVYYGADLRSLSGQAITAVMAAAVLVPLEIGFPLVFQRANKLPTGVLRSKMQQEYLRRKRQQKRRLRRLRHGIALAASETAPALAGAGDSKAAAACPMDPAQPSDQMTCKPEKPPSLEPSASMATNTARGSLGSDTQHRVERGGLQIELPHESGSQASAPDSDMLGISARGWNNLPHMANSRSSSAASSPGYLFAGGGQRMNFSATVAPNQMADVRRVLEALNLAKNIPGLGVPADQSGRISVVTVESGGFSSVASGRDGFVDDGELFGQLAVGHLLDMVGRAAGDTSLAAGNFDLGHVRSMQHPVSGRRRLVVSSRQDAAAASGGGGLSSLQRTVVVEISTESPVSGAAVDVAPEYDASSPRSESLDADAFFVGQGASGAAATGAPPHKHGGAFSGRELAASSAQHSALHVKSPAAAAAAADGLAWLQAYAALDGVGAPSGWHGALYGMQHDTQDTDSSTGGSLVQHSRADTFSSLPPTGRAEEPEEPGFPARPTASSLTAASRPDHHSLSDRNQHQERLQAPPPIKGILKRPIESSTLPRAGSFKAVQLANRETPVPLRSQPNTRPVVRRLPVAKRRQEAIIAAHRAARRCIRCRSFLAVANLIQVWAGLAGVALAVFLFSGLYTPEAQDMLPIVAVAECPAAGCDANSTATARQDDSVLAGLGSSELTSIGTFGIGFAVLIVLGLLGNYAARWSGGARTAQGCRQRGLASASTSGLLWLLAVSMEVATAAWMVARNMPFAREGIYLVLAMQALPLGVALAAAVVLSRSARTATPPGQDSRSLVLDDTVNIPEQQQKDLLEQVGGSRAALEAVLRVQAVFRGQLGRARASRARELAAWESLSWQHWSLQCIIYSVLLTVLSAGVYALLLFGSRFTFAQGIAWSRAVLLAFLFDMCIQQPLLAFVWVSYVFVSDSCRRPAQVVIVERLASNARAAQVLHEAAIIRDGETGLTDSARARAALPSMEHLNSQQLLTIDAALSSPATLRAAPR